MQEVEGSSQATPTTGGGIHTDCRPDDRPPSNTTNSQKLVESILELRETLQHRLRTNVLYAAKTKVDEFLELLGHPEYETDFLSQPPVEEAARSQENDIHPTPEGPGDAAEELGSRIPPIRRGGGRFVGERSGPTERPPFFNVQLIAHFDANVWQILVEVGAEETECPEFAVQQGSGASGERLQEIQPFTFGPLRDLRPIRILSGEVVHREKRLDRVACPIFFRVVQNDFGRHVANPLQGLNLAMVPANWKYDSKKSGPPPHEPEACSLRGYMLHYFSGARSPGTCI